MYKTIHFLAVACLIAVFTGVLYADCPYDHLIIGCNRDGEPNTPDDRMLYLDTQDLYRRSDPANEGDYTWLNWYYPMKGTGAIRFNTSPGFGMYHHPDESGTFQFEDSIRCLVGTKSVDYSITVECLDMSDNLQVKEPPFTLIFNQPGDTFDHSGETDVTGHIHFTYEVPAPGDALQWITFQIYDEFYDPDHPETGYLPSEPITVVFGCLPVPGDIHVDGSVDILDLDKLGSYWLSFSESTRYNSFGEAAIDKFDRTDINRDYDVNFLDFSLLAQNWLSAQ